MSNPILNYTDLTYSEIKDQIISRISQDSRFSNFSESQLYSMLIEIFGATTDFTNYYIERTAEETFPQSAQLKSSVIQIANILGYVVTRPTPAQTSITITINSIPQGAAANQLIEIKAGTKFTFNGLTFTLLNSLTYTLTQIDINNYAADPNYFKLLEFYSSEPGYEHQLNDTELIPEAYRTPITIIQAEQKIYTIDPNNTLPDQRFQTYRIDDKTFSNFYGNDDFGFNIETGSTDLTLNSTRIAVGNDIVTAFCDTMEDYSSKKEFIIDRRSLLNSDTIPQLTAIDSGKTVKYCILKTNMDETVQLEFGDDIITAIGATGNNSIFIKYLSTKGSAGNFNGVIGRKVECQTNDFNSSFTNQNLKFTLRRNVVGGNDLEDIESIKINSPEIFYSLDRCVTPRDYVSYLKTLFINSKQVKNALAWGEQEETRDNTYKISNIKLFNVVLFSILADMYSKINGKYVGVDLDENILLNTSNSSDWFNLMVISDSTTPLKDPAINDPNNSDLLLIYNKLYSRSEITVKNIYVTPVIRKFKLTGKIYLNSLVDKNNTYDKITDAIYSYLSKIADFNTPIYLSKIIDIVQNFSEVNHADLSFTPISDPTVDYFYHSDNPSELESISASFPSAPIGYVFNSSTSAKDRCDIREYSVSGVDSSLSFFQKELRAMGLSTDYSENTIDTIACLMPRLEMKIYKFDSVNARTEPIWPSTNSINNKTCSIPTTNTTGDINYSYVPSERNLYLGMMQCVYNNLMTIVSRDPTLATTTDTAEINKMFDEFLANRDNCFCSLKQLGQLQKDQEQTNLCNQYIQAASPSEIKNFIDKDLLNVLDKFKNTMSYSITSGLLDSYGNIVNFSLKNEIAQIKAPGLAQYFYK